MEDLILDEESDINDENEFIFSQQSSISNRDEPFSNLIVPILNNKK